jgi:hypothetical protein
MSFVRGLRGELTGSRCALRRRRCRRFAPATLSSRPLWFPRSPPHGGHGDSAGVVLSADSPASCKRRCRKRGGRSVRHVGEHTFVMHARAIRRAALELISAGVNDCEIGRRLGLPRTTVRDMRWTAARRDRRVPCARCWAPMPPVRFSDADYAQLLGLYLGDGHTRSSPARRSCASRWTRASRGSSPRPRGCSVAAFRTTAWAG